MTTVPPKPNLLEIAQKQREVKMLEKIQRGNPLTQSEMKELARYQNGGASSNLAESQEQVAKVFKVTSRTVANWVKEGMPVTKDGQYDLLEIQSWRFHRRFSKDADGKEVDWDAKYREFKARIEEGKFLTMIGQLISMQEVEDGLIQISTEIKRALLSLPRSLAPRLGGLEPREIEKVIRERVEEVINLFAKDRIFQKNEKTKDMDG